MFSCTNFQELYNLIKFVFQKVKFTFKLQEDILIITLEIDFVYTKKNMVLKLGKLVQK